MYRVSVAVGPSGPLVLVQIGCCKGDRNNLSTCHVFTNHLARQSKYFYSIRRSLNQDCGGGCIEMNAKGAALFTKRARLQHSTYNVDAMNVCPRAVHAISKRCHRRCTCQCDGRSRARRATTGLTQHICRLASQHDQGQNSG